MSQIVWIFFAVLIVLALIGAAAYLVRRFAGRGLGSGNSRGRMPRLAVIDAAAVDGRRRLVLVRRDNVEHLLMIGGPSDIVVEPNIVRNSAGRDAAPSRQPAGTELPPRVALPDTNWSEPTASHAEPFEFPEPHTPPPAPRPSRSSLGDDLRRAPSLAPERTREDPLAGAVPEPSLRSEPTLRPERPPSRPLPRSERLEPSLSRAPRLDTPARPAPRAPEPVSAADQNLAEMAQRLEAALRRPGTRVEATAETRTVSVTSAERIGAPSVAPEAPAPRSAALDIVPGEAEPARPAFENLEDEMASLLGRPKNPT
jgi:flagellar biogenesis protein FliO